jgi:hypothetical protein
MNRNPITLRQRVEQSIICVNYKSVPAFLQAVQESGARVVHLEALERPVRLSQVWGLLLTARLGDEIHVAWVVAACALSPSPRQQAWALAKQEHLSRQVRALIAEHGLEIKPGFYALAPASLLYQHSASLSEGPASQEGGH